MSQSLAQPFADDGFVVLRGLLPPDEITGYIARLKELAGDKERWTQPDGVGRNAAFWPIIFNPRLLAAVREIFGPAVRYLPHNDLHFGFSSFSWHRDSVTRERTAGADWDESREPYRLARVGLYLQRFEESRFRLGLIRGSHKPRAAESEAGRRVERRTSAAANVLSGLTGVDLVGGDAEWIATEPGDAIIFDPRILHTGSKFHGVKYSVFVAYGIENTHFRNHWQYYRNLRTDLGYAPLDPGLVEQLRAADLLAAAPPDDLRVADAWIPSPTFTYVARHFK